MVWITFLSSSQNNFSHNDCFNIILASTGVFCSCVASTMNFRAKCLAFDNWYNPQCRMTQGQFLHHQTVPMKKLVQVVLGLQWSRVTLLHDLMPLEWSLETRPTSQVTGYFLAAVLETGFASHLHPAHSGIFDANLFFNFVINKYTNLFSYVFKWFCFWVTKFSGKM